MQFLGRLLEVLGQDLVGQVLLHDPIDFHQGPSASGCKAAPKHEGATSMLHSDHGILGGISLIWLPPHIGCTSTPKELNFGLFWAQKLSSFLRWSLEYMRRALRGLALSRGVFLGLYACRLCLWSTLWRADLNTSVPDSLRLCRKSLEVSLGLLFTSLMSFLPALAEILGFLPLPVRLASAMHLLLPDVVPDNWDRNSKRLGDGFEALVWLPLSNYELSGLHHGDSGDHELLWPPFYLYRQEKSPLNFSPLAGSSSIYWETRQKHFLLRLYKIVTYLQHDRKGANNFEQIPFQFMYLNSS